ncbi:hypothetical protein JCM10450v2_005868 [Rhodotorula kratochvilovae]
MAAQQPYGAPPYRPYSPAPLAALQLPHKPSTPSSTAPSSPSSSSHPLPGTSTSPVSSPGLWRSSALSPQQSKSIGQTRMRARSIGKGVPQLPLPHLSPTLPGSPVPPPGMASVFEAGQHARAHGEVGFGLSPLARQRAEQDRRAFSGSDLSEVDEPPTSTEGTEESGSTRSDSPPRTPRDSYGAEGSAPEYWVEPPSRRGSDTEREEREAWRTGGETEEEALARAKEVATRNRSKSLEGMTRLSLRRGRSFTSLLGQPVTPSPGPERKDPLAATVVPPPPIFEQYEPPPTPIATSDFEVAEARQATLYPPASGAALAAPPPVSKTLRDFVPQLIILSALFVSSFAVIAFTISTLPGLFLPHSVADLPALTKTLTTYRASSFGAELHLFTVLTLLFLWKQCFSIPGSVLTNILFGALYGTTLGTWWACLWTAAGSTGAYAIALVIAPLVEYYFAKPLDMTRRALKLPTPGAANVAQPGVAPLSNADLFSHLLLARFFPLLPYSVLNVISGVLRLPLGPFFITLLLGSFPFNFATVSIGNLVALAAADPSVPLGDKIWSREVVLKLVAVTLVSVLPLVFKEQLKRLLSSGGALERARDLAARALFGFGAVPASAGVGPGHAHSLSAPAGAGSGPRAWRRKLSRSIGGAGDLLMSGFGRVSAVGAERGGGWGYQRVPLEGATGALDEAEMGGVH